MDTQATKEWFDKVISGELQLMPLIGVRYEGTFTEGQRRTAGVITSVEVNNGFIIINRDDNDMTKRYFRYATGGNVQKVISRAIEESTDFVIQV